MIEKSHEMKKRAQSLDVQAWTVRRLVNAIHGNGSERIFIPSFQRSFVWKKNRQDALIESIRDCTPVGSLLFYDDGIKNEQQRYEIVDGLQRSTSLVRYERAVFETFRPESIDDEWIDRFIDSVAARPDDELERRLHEKKIRNAVAGWLRTCVSFESGGGFRIALLIDAVEHALGTSNLMLRDGVVDLAQEFLAEMRTRLDVGEYKIPVVVFSGERSVLPDIFENLNTTGVKLNKYDILASSWNDTSLVVTSVDLRDGIRERIEALSKGEVERNPADVLPADKFYLYDTVCAFGNLISSRYPDLFQKKSKKADEPASCGFNVVALAFELGLSEIGKVPEQLARTPSSEGFLTDVITATAETLEMLRPTIGGVFEGRTSATQRHAHQELQMSAIVASVYRAGNALGPGAYLSRAERTRAMRQHYLHDAIRAEWSGTGDSKALATVRSDRYGTLVPRTTFYASAHSWYQNHLQDARQRGPKSPWIRTDCMAWMRAYVFASGVQLDDVDGVIKTECAFPQAAILTGTPWIISNVRLVDAAGHVLADPGRALPNLPSDANDKQLSSHLEQRFKAMLDAIAREYEFVD